MIIVGWTKSLLHEREIKDIDASLVFSRDAILGRRMIFMKLVLRLIA